MRRVWGHFRRASDEELPSFEEAVAADARGSAARRASRSSTRAASGRSARVPELERFDGSKGRR